MAVSRSWGVLCLGDNMSPTRLDDCWLMQHTKTEVLSGGSLMSRTQAFCRACFERPRKIPMSTSTLQEPGLYFYIWHGAMYRRSCSYSNHRWIVRRMSHAKPSHCSRSLSSLMPAQGFASVDSSTCNVAGYILPPFLFSRGCRAHAGLGSSCRL